MTRCMKLGLNVYNNSSNEIPPIGEFDFLVKDPTKYPSLSMLVLDSPSEVTAYGDVMTKINNRVNGRNDSKEYSKSVNDCVLALTLAEVEYDETDPNAKEKIINYPDGTSYVYPDNRYSSAIFCKEESDFMKSYSILRIDTKEFISPVKFPFSSSEVDELSFLLFMYSSDLHIEGLKVVNEHKFIVDGKEYTDQTFETCERYLEIMTLLACKMAPGPIFIICNYGYDWAYNQIAYRIPKEAIKNRGFFVIAV